jgi:hypothetical protein
VFSDGAFVGFTPVTLTLEGDEARVVRVLLAGHEEETVVVEAAPAPEGHRTREERVVLAPTVRAALLLKCDPAGADVFLDGRRLGAAPLQFEDLSPGRRLLRVQKRDYVSHEETIDLKPEETTTVSCELVSRWSAFYEQSIAERPEVMTNYAELAHHYTILGEFEKAEAVVAAGLAMMRNWKDLEGEALRAYRETRYRFYEELMRIYTRFFAYPDDGAGTLRAACMETMETIVAEGLAQDKRAMQGLKTMRAYDKRKR